MTKDIREAAEVFVRYIEDCYSSCSSIKASKQYNALKAALRPSRKEIADYLEGELTVGDITDDEVYKYINYAIEELRRND